MHSNDGTKLPHTYLIRLTYLYFLALVLVITGVHIGALYLQIIHNELPCPLCLLQRVAYFGICFGVLLNLRNGYSLRFEGLIQLMTVILLVISTRQTLLDIYPRPGHEYIGSTILNIHMPVWSIIISVLLLFAYSIRYCVFGQINYLRNISINAYPSLKTIANMLFLVIILLCALNLLLVFLQCKFNACHTENYQVFNPLTLVSH